MTLRAIECGDIIHDTSSKLMIKYNVNLCYFLNYIYYAVHLQSYLRVTLLTSTFNLICTL